MPMIQGTVSIDPTTAAVSGSGFALALFNLMWPRVSSKMPAVPTTVVAEAKQGVADDANAIASVIGYIQANAQVASGIPVATAGSAAAQTGATTAPGTIL